MHAAAAEDSGWAAVAGRARAIRAAAVNTPVASARWGVGLTRYSFGGGRGPACSVAGPGGLRRGGRGAGLREHCATPVRAWLPKG
ncbi:hypothetical protein GCM10017776_12950 [Streptomyces griseoluteus]|nr:hypothetical protein GCM10017776_12950 [Streptomyces griseoluteus]